MAAEPAQALDLKGPDGKWLPGRGSPNPGGHLRSVRELERKVLERHGDKVVEALQALYDLGMTSDSDKVRVAALDCFVKHVKGAPRPPKDDEAPVADEAALLERVVDSVVSRSPELVAAKLTALKGGKAE